MSMTATFLIVLSQFTTGKSTVRTCVPNKQFLMNGRLCSCDSFGRWSEANCHLPVRRENCQSGQVIWQGCNQCICQENGMLSCSSAGCVDGTTKSSTNLRENPPTMGEWCTPFKPYYVNCSICVCPASGQTSQAHCASDESCHNRQLSSDMISSNNNVCIPNVMYLFPCLHCQCSEGGYFALDKCVETCQDKQQTESPRRCIPRTFYRKHCNVCWCPEYGVPDEKYCTKVICNNKTKFRFLRDLRRRSTRCASNKFTKPKCYYCECNSEGTLNENACLELDCLGIKEFQYDSVKETCSPGEMVPICIECLCLSYGQTNNTYCTRVCSYEAKLDVLRNVIRVNNKKNSLIDRESLNTSIKEFCEPNSVYIDQERYCMCPENGNSNFKLCVSPPGDKRIISSRIKSLEFFIDDAFGATCEPNSFVEIDCNTCYCSKKGKIDTKWCTYDDCESKRITLENQKSLKSPTNSTPELEGICNPGSISKINCNFCICPNTGKSKEKVCTKNKCVDVQPTNTDIITCDPLAYYLVDCNTCLCPRDGLKNVDECTKNLCEKSFLRSLNCVPGELFCDDCNVCVCPPNGDKRDKVCTNHTCSDFDTPWKGIFKISQNLLANLDDVQESTRKLDLCFPGEEFVVGCKVCVCPDMGLRAYASCTPMLCDDEQNQKNYLDQDSLGDLNQDDGELLARSRRKDDGCSLDDSDCFKKKCTSGSVYINRCRECLCSDVENSDHFCRPLPPGIPCDPNTDDDLPMVSLERVNRTVYTSSNTTTLRSSPETKHTCPKPGRIMSNCFICECEEDMVVVEERCYKSVSETCAGAEPTILRELNVGVVS